MRAVCRLIRSSTASGANLLLSSVRNAAIASSSPSLGGGSRIRRPCASRNPPALTCSSYRPPAGTFRQDGRDLTPFHTGGFDDHVKLLARTVHPRAVDHPVVDQAHLAQPELVVRRSEARPSTSTASAGATGLGYRGGLTIRTKPFWVIAHDAHPVAISPSSQTRSIMVDVVAVQQRQEHV